MFSRRLDYNCWFSLWMWHLDRVSSTFGDYIGGLFVLEEWLGLQVDFSDVTCFFELFIGLSVDASTAVPLHLAGLEEFRDSGLLDLGSHFEMGVHLLTAIYFIINLMLWHYYTTNNQHIYSVFMRQRDSYMIYSNLFVSMLFLRVILKLSFIT